MAISLILLCLLQAQCYHQASPWREGNMLSSALPAPNAKYDPHLDGNILSLVGRGLA